MHECIKLFCLTVLVHNLATRTQSHEGCCDDVSEARQALPVNASWDLPGISRNVAVYLAAIRSCGKSHGPSSF